MVSKAYDRSLSVWLHRSRQAAGQLKLLEFVDGVPPSLHNCSHSVACMYISQPKKCFNSTDLTLATASTGAHTSEHLLPSDVYTYTYIHIYMYMRKGLGIFFENREKPAATRD